MPASDRVRSSRRETKGPGEQGWGLSYSSQENVSQPLIAPDRWPGSRLLAAAAGVMIPLSGRAVIFGGCHMRLRTWLLALVAVVAAAFLLLAVACGGGEKESPKASPTTTAAKTPTAATKTPAAGETPEKTPAGEAGELSSIAAYPGAKEFYSGPFNSGEVFPIPLGSDVPISPDEYGGIQYTIYETSDSSEEVVGFYKEEFKDWKEEGTFDLEQVAGQKGEAVVWTKDDGKVAAWLGVFEEARGVTSFAIAVGARQQ
jgi:hypothetical protein